MPLSINIFPKQMWFWDGILSTADASGSAGVRNVFVDHR